MKQIVFITNVHLDYLHITGFMGNLCKNCIFSNLKFENFAVAAIHLNGSHNVVVDNVIADNKDINIKINSLFLLSTVYFRIIRIFKYL